MTTRQILPVLILLGVFGVGPAPPASGAVSHGLVGITICCPNEFVQVDPATGGLTTLSNVGDENFGFISSPAVDPATHSFYIVRISDASASPAMVPHVVTINTRTGALAESPPLAKGIFALGFDSASSTLAGITVCCPNEFVRVDPATGGLTTLSNVGDGTFGFTSSPAVDPATHSFYIVRFSTDSQPHVVTINTQTGVLVESPPLAKGIFALGFDSVSSSLVGITVCCPNEFVRVDPATGGLTTLSNVGDGTFGFTSSPAVDPATHSFHIVRFSTDSQPHVVTINTQTGAFVESPPLAKGIFTLGFDPSVADTPTPDSIKSAINGFLADGAVRNSGLAQSLLAKVDAAARATAAGNCDAAAKMYRAFIKQVRAQSGLGLTQVAAELLISQAEFLATAPCP